MKNIINKNPLQLAVLVTIFSIIIGLITALILDILNLDFESSGTIAGIAGCITIGGMYAEKYGEIIPDHIRNRVALYYIGFQFLIAIVVFKSFGLLDDNVVIKLIGLVLISAFLFLIYRWLLKSGGKNHLKALEKRKRRKSSN